MILPIYLYGHSVLRKKSEDITKEYSGFRQLISDMFETMYKAEGVGLAAPQIGKNINIIVIDASPMADEENDEDELKNFKRVFVNPKITYNSDEKKCSEEGCLSIPNIHEKVDRYVDLTIEYFNENFEKLTEHLVGAKAKIIQHEYDHLNGELFIDKISPIRRKLLNKKLSAIAKGKIATRYPIVKN
ncbi:peptide deformylase [Bacteroidales bacterium OttesenSCG-928-I21]|nr:peptide deformylase [Bacteroidales bacterium OttesenSCG-928-I21]